MRGGGLVPFVEAPHRDMREISPVPLFRVNPGKLSALVRFTRYAVNRTTRG